MSRSKFGWSYPPGAANDPNAPYNQDDDGPCAVCCKCVTDCICPECPVCGETGNPKCYLEEHESETDLTHEKMKLTREQAISRAECSAMIAKRNWREAEMVVEYLKQEESEFEDDLAANLDPWR
jgi:hypothetical protein